MKRAMVVLGIVLAGCAVERANLAERAQSELVGMTKVDLLSCAGVPARSAKEGGIEVLTYDGGGDVITAGGTVGAYNGVHNAYGSNGTFGGVNVSRGRRLYCEATFVIQDGKVAKVSYSGQTGGLLTKGEQCAFIVENCVKPQ
jgi:hypothetical protein